MGTFRTFEEFEQVVRNILADRLREECPDAPLNVFHNRKYKGQSGHEHQIDVSAELTLAGCQILILVECKNYKAAIGIDDLLEFAARLRDIGAHKGIVVTTVGYQEGAKKIAEANGIALVLESPGLGFVGGCHAGAAAARWITWSNCPGGTGRPADATGDCASGSKDIEAKRQGCGHVVS